MREAILGLVCTAQARPQEHHVPPIERLTPGWRQYSNDLGFLWVVGTPVSWLMLCAKLLGPYHDLHAVNSILATVNHMLRNRRKQLLAPAD